MTPTQRAAALRLADYLNAQSSIVSRDGAALLRELAAEPPNCGDFDRLTAEVEADPAMQEHLSAGREWVKTLAREPVQETVAWMAESKSGTVRFTNIGQSADELASMGWTVTPLYAAPQQRQPLGLDAIYEIWDQVDDPNGEDILVFARMLEKAHGITGGKE